MSSKRFNKLPKDSSRSKPDLIEKLIPLVKKIAQQDLMRL